MRGQRRCGPFIEKERYGNLQDVRQVLQAAGRYPVRALSYFWICWNVMPSALPSSPCVIPSRRRRIRTRLPISLSVDSGALLIIGLVRSIAFRRCEPLRTAVPHYDIAA